MGYVHISPKHKFHTNPHFPAAVLLLIFLKEVSNNLVYFFNNTISVLASHSVFHTDISKRASRFPGKPHNIWLFTNGGTLWFFLLQGIVFLASTLIHCSFSLPLRTSCVTKISSTQKQLFIIRFFNVISS